MYSFKQRSFEKELLDGENIPFQDIALNMKELNVINTILGGHTISKHGFKQLCTTLKHVTVCEVGCGGGDNMISIQEYATKNDIHINWIGIDLNPHCVDYAKKQCASLKALWITKPYKDVKLEAKPDIIFCSLFTHHLNDIELKEFIQWCNNNARLGFFINDLHRNSIAYWSIKILTSLFSSSYLVKNDAPRSVKRGFLKQEWIDLFRQLNVKNYTVKWKWAFRHLIVVKHGL